MTFLIYFGTVNHICFNGKILPGEEPVLLASNRSYRYGDGLFETMKLENGEIRLASFHFERLFSGLSLLKFELPGLFTREKMEKEILQLCKKSGYENLARVRLSVSRGNGGLYDDNKGLQYLIECFRLDDSVGKLNENGLMVDVYPYARKSPDTFANLKSANFLPYSMAALYAKEHQLNDSLVLNTAGRITDSTIANIFVIRGQRIITPALTEGCVNGVMRRYLVEKMRETGYDIAETSLTTGEIEAADEVFLTNAINGIRWVKQIRDKRFTNATTTEIYKRFIPII